MNSLALKLTELKFSYGPGFGLGPITKELPWGEIHLLQGRSGTGKSTLMALAGLILTPTAGEVLVDGVATRGLSESQRDQIRQDRLTIVWQDAGLFPYLSAWENVAARAGVPTKKLKAAAIAALAEVGLADLAEQRPAALSGGQRQRVGFARAILNPGLVLADEPTANLDKESAIQVVAALQAVVKNGGSALVATHDDILNQVQSEIWQMQELTK